DAPQGERRAVRYFDEPLNGDVDEALQVSARTQAARGARRDVETERRRQRGRSGDEVIVEERIRLAIERERLLESSRRRRRDGADRDAEIRRLPFGNHVSDWRERPSRDVLPEAL